MSTADPNTALVLRNASVLTMDPASPSADAVAIVGDTITAVGTDAEVLGLITSVGAYATFEEDRKGTVTVGKLADLVVLNDDPRTVATTTSRVCVS